MYSLIIDQFSTQAAHGALIGAGSSPAAASNINPKKTHNNMKSILLIQPASPLAACSILKDIKQTGVAYKFLNSWHQIAVPCQTKKVALMVLYAAKARHSGPQAVYSITRKTKYTWPN